MKIIKTIKDFRKYRKLLTGRCGFVPTMGYLHEGHAFLMKSAGKECKTVIVSNFVNPTQFGPTEDFARYPRDFEKDEELCKKAGVDCIFYPDVKEMYPGDELTTVRVAKITEKLCGMTRPTHFEGVTTVVTKLFNIVQPDIAYFGQKDLQQTIVVKRMVKDLNIPVDIKVCPVIREKDGLAMSSRNSYLNARERKIAPIIHESLQMAKNMFEKQETNALDLKEAVKQKINEKVSADVGRIDYVEIIDTESLESPINARPGNAIAIAVHIGKTRLIDNIIL